MRRTIFVVTMAAALFWAGRHLHTGRGRQSATVRSPMAGVEITEANAEAKRRGGSPIVILADRLAAALAQAQSPAREQLEKEVLGTVTEPEAHREARHKELVNEIDRLYPSLDPSKRDLLQEISDRSDAELRRQRASFLLDQISEDEYIAALKESVRQGVAAAKQALSRDEFVRLEGNPDYDPFDPSAHMVPGAEPYLSREEAELRKNLPPPPPKSEGVADEAL